MASTLNGSSAGIMPIALSCHSLSYICVCECKTRMHDLFVARPVGSNYRLGGTHKFFLNDRPL